MLLPVHAVLLCFLTAEGGLTFSLSSKVGYASQKLAGHSPHDRNLHPLAKLGT